MPFRENVDRLSIVEPTIPGMEPNFNAVRSQKLPQLSRDVVQFQKPVTCVGPRFGSTTGPVLNRAEVRSDNCGDFILGKRCLLKISNNLLIDAAALTAGARCGLDFGCGIHVGLMYGS